jgi:hypothetical protein
MSKKQEIKIKADVKVFIDAKTGARTIALPFRLSDNQSAVLMISRLKDAEWAPSKEITNITITYA